MPLSNLISGELCSNALCQPHTIHPVNIDNLALLSYEENVKVCLYICMDSISTWIGNSTKSQEYSWLCTGLVKTTLGSHLEQQGAP